MKRIIILYTTLVSLVIGQLIVHANTSTGICTYYVPTELLYQISNDITGFETERCNTKKEFCDRPVAVMINIEKPIFELTSTDQSSLDIISLLENKDSIKDCINLNQYKILISRELGNINKKIRFTPTKNDDEKIEQIIKQIEEYGPGGVERSSLNRLKRRQINYYIRFQPKIILSESSLRVLSSQISNTSFETNELDIFQISTFELSGELLSLENFDKVYLNNFSNKYIDSPVSDLSNIFNINILFNSKRQPTHKSSDYEYIYDFELSIRTLNNPFCIDSEIEFQCRSIEDFKNNEVGDQHCTNAFKPIKFSRQYNTNKWTSSLNLRKLNRDKECFLPKEHIKIPFSIIYEEPPFEYPDPDPCAGDDPVTGQDPYECREELWEREQEHNEYRHRAIETTLRYNRFILYIKIDNLSTSSDDYKKSIYLNTYNR